MAHPKIIQLGVTRPQQLKHGVFGCDHKEETDISRLKEEKWELCLYSLSRFLLCLNPTNPSQQPISPIPFSHQSSLQSSSLTPISPTNPSFEAVKRALANLGSWMIMVWLMIWTVISTTSLLSMILFGTPNPHGRISPPC